MHCLNCKKRVPHVGGYCSYCGSNFSSGQRTRKLIHPKRPISESRIASLIMTAIALMLVFVPWIKINKESFYIYELINKDFYLYKLLSDNVSKVEIIFTCSIVMTIMKAIIAISCVCHILMDLLYKTPTTNAKHIFCQKIFDNISVICYFVFLFLNFILKDFCDEFKFNYWQFIHILVIAFSRYLIIPEYYDGYIHNIKMLELDRKYS